MGLFAVFFFADWQVGALAGCLVGRVAGWQVGWLAGWLVDRLAGLPYNTTQCNATQYKASPQDPPGPP